ncbi:DUF2249 domain-containing protein [Arthrobacter sp. H35-D1]|uniref:DUF2249 domain-containing protein n=1 Tax=Arthrobacter sp. H35-D1 TaxID=3046202 RepID=UPI0024BB51A6|nr:DUF2249 domain-containing protein [Arthrobacter sp. H35-D1]MDJ0312638.1 DUF2249 domain-containing protein [Arthrobacter sp. H35-D1]
MNNLVLASSSTEAASLEDARTRLAEAAGTVLTLGGNLVAAATNPAGEELAQADQGALVDFAEMELLPLAAALAGAFQTADLSDDSLKLVASLATAHSTRLVSATKELEVQEYPVNMVHAGGRLQEAVAVFVDQASELVLPALAQNPGVTLSQVLPAHTATVATASEVPAQGGCACGGHDEPGLSELDTRVIPHAIRHATIFGALEGLTTGRGILLVANHNPLPLLAQLEQRAAGKFTVDYVENGPELWKLSMVRN